MPSFNIKDYVILAATLIILALGGALWIEAGRLELMTSKYNEFVADTKSKGLQQKLDNIKTEDALRQAAVNIQERYNAKVSEFDNLAATADKLRNEASASSRRASEIAKAASNLNCPNIETKLSAAMGNLRIGVLERFIKPLMQCNERAQACKDYVDDLQSKLGEVSNGNVNHPD